MRSLSLCFLLMATATMAQTDANDLLKAADTEYRAGHLDAAMEQVERALALDPLLAGAYKLRGDIHQRQHNLEAALEDYRSSEKLDNSNPRLYVSRSALHISEGHARNGLRDADKAIDLAPEDADAWYNRAWALYLGDDLEAALKSVRRALEVQPGFPEALYLSGVVKGARYDEQEGAREVAEALALKPSIPGGLMSLAVLLYEDKRYAEAIEKLTEVIATDTTELAQAYYYRADCHYNLGDKEKACMDWRRSMGLGDKDAAFIKRTYCDTEATKIPKKPKRKRRITTIQF